MDLRVTSKPVINYKIKDGFCTENLFNYAQRAQDNRKVSAVQVSVHPKLKEEHNWVCYWNSIVTIDFGYRVPCRHEFLIKSVFPTHI